MKFDGLARRSRAARPEAEDGREDSPDLLGSFWPPNLGVLCFPAETFCGQKSKRNSDVVFVAGYKRSQNYEMAKTFEQNCAKHSNAVAKRAGLHVTFAGRANEK